MNHLKLVRFFVENDFEIMINAFQTAATMDNDKAGCYSLLRIIFPLIDHMGQLLLGKAKQDHSNAMKQYIIDFMGKVNPKYVDFAGLLVKMYRHGLLHQLQPNRIKHKNLILEWNLYYRESYCDHLICKREGKKRNRFYFNIELFAKDFHKSVFVYEKSLRKDNNLKANYHSALKKMEEALDTSRLKDNWLNCKDFKILDSK